MKRPDRCSGLVLGSLGSLLLAGMLAAQLARPEGEVSFSSASSTSRLADAGWRLLRGADLTAARDVFRRLRAIDVGDPRGLLGLGEVHLELGNATLAGRYARAARRLDPASDAAAALEVRALLRARRFDEAIDVSTTAVSRLPDPGADLWAAHASALFRVQRTSEAARAYRRVLALEPLHPEAHVRLGSGLTDPVTVRRTPALVAGVDALQSGRHASAIQIFRGVLEETPSHPVAHRLLGETLLHRESLRGVTSSAAEFRALAAALPTPAVEGLPVQDFMPAFDRLCGERRAVAARALALFSGCLPRLVAMGGRHDLLLELERTTEAPARADLRGRRTFDGRVWDDVRGIGGLRAATGIESLDEAARFGFDTLAHELAHQAHLYAFRAVDRHRVRRLYRQARDEDRFLDYYAANNEAEYFGQGVEAFVSYGKRPGGEATHGHTRFELKRVDPELHDFIAEIVDWDPLREPAVRERILAAAAGVALRVGRPRDAVVAARMMGAGPARERLLAAARRALVFSRSY